MKRLSISPTAVVILLCTLAICMVSIFVISPAQAAVDPENLFEFGGEYYYFDDYGNMYLYDEEAEKTPEGADGDSSGGDYGSIPSGNGVFSISDQSGGYYGDIPTGEEALGAITGQTNLPEVTTDDVQNWVDRKGGELISIIIRIVQVVSVIGFVLCIILIVIGAVGNSRTLVGGVIGLIFCCVCFTAATMAPQIIAAVNGCLIN